MNNDSNCTMSVPVCLSDQNGDSGIKLCANNIMFNKTIYYNYESCPRDSIVQLKVRDGINCQCHDLMTQCVPENRLWQKCYHFFIGIGSAQIAIIIIGVLLNCIIMHSFYRKVNLKKKIPNILLANQAFADLVNLIIYGLPNFVRALDRLIHVISLPHSISHIIEYALLLTIASSVILFFIIALDRFIAIHNPLWHRANVNKKHIWAGIVGAWLVAIALTITSIAIHQEGLDLESPFGKFLIVLLGILITLVTVLHVCTFIKAFKSFYWNPDVSTNQIWKHPKKQFRLVLMFIIMYCIFSVGFFPLMISFASKEGHSFELKSQIIFSLFIAISVLNPLLTLCLKSQFRITCAASRNENRNTNTML